MGGYTDIPFKYNSAWGGQFQKGGNIFQAQDGLTSGDVMLNNIYSKWPALKKLGNVTIKPDESFTRDKTGVGDIEFFSPNTPQVTYSNGYVAQNPGVDGYGILYNPSTNDEQNVRLDMLHGMAEADPHYRRLRNRFERAVKHSDIYNEMNHWYNIDKEKGNAEDGREKWIDNYIDGQLRTLLYEGDRAKQNYSDEEANQLLSHPRIKRKFNKLNNYLQKGELAMGGSIPGSVGFTYARTNSPAPSEGPYAKKTMPSAQNGQEMKYYQEGLDWKPRTISKNGGWLDKYIPEAQTGLVIPGVTDFKMPRLSNESTSLGTKIDEAAIRQAQIDRAREKQGTISKAAPKRSAASKAWAVATHPMTALQYKVKGQDIPENFDRGERNILENAVDIINPTTYLNAAGRTAHNITSPKEMLYRTLNSIEGDDNMLDVAGDALLTAGIPQLTRSGLSTIDKQFSKVGRALEDIRFRGEVAGLSPHEIASQQLKKVGITSNQREAYIPGVSDLVNKYVTPFGYEGIGGKSKISEIIENIKKGGQNIEKTRVAGPERQDAWSLYLGMPQKNKTFALSNTVPELHPSYPAGSLEGMDIYNIRSKKDFRLYPNYGPDDLPSEYLKDLENPITYHRDQSVMGGYNARMTKQGTEYNDIWDLEPNVTLKSLFPKKFAEHPRLDNIFYKKRIVNGVETGTPRGITIPVDKFIGKPFMSHGITPYTSYDYLGELSTQIKDKINRFAPNVNTSFNGPERMAKMQQDLENVKKYSPKYKKGGVIKDDRGQWAHPGEITEIGSNRITMQGVPYPVLGISDTGHTQMMFPGEEYKFKGKKVTEYPMAQKGRKVAPVYVNDPNDPRLKLYTDSLSTYNKSLNPWHWPGTKVTTKQDYEKKLKLQRDFPNWSFDEDQYKKDKKKGKFKDFNDYVYDVGMVDKGDPKALDAFNRNTGKHFKDFEEPIEKKLPDGRIKQYWGTYKGKLDESNYTIYDPVTGSSSHYTHSGNGPDTFLGIYNPNIKPIGHMYHAFDQPYNTGEIYISSEDSEYVNKVLKNKTNKKKNYINYTYGANDNGVYKEPVQPVIYDKKKYNPNDPRLKQLQESFDKFHSNIGKKSKEQPKKSEPKPEKPQLDRQPNVQISNPSLAKQMSTQLVGMPSVSLPNMPIQQGNYMVGYFDENNQGVDRGFLTPEQRDAFVEELRQRNLSSVQPYRGNITQYYRLPEKVNKKESGGWLNQYK